MILHHDDPDVVEGGNILGHGAFLGKCGARREGQPAHNNQSSYLHKRNLLGASDWFGECHRVCGDKMENLAGDCVRRVTGRLKFDEWNESPERDLTHGGTATRLRISVSSSRLRIRVSL